MKTIDLTSSRTPLKGRGKHLYAAMAATLNPQVGDTVILVSGQFSATEISEAYQIDNSGPRVGVHLKRQGR